MEDKGEPQTWQELLQQIIKNPAEKKRIVQQANIHAITLTRWIKEISTPRVEKKALLAQSAPMLFLSHF